MRTAAAAAAVAVAVLTAGCESTFDKAARREREQAAAVAAPKLSIKATDAVAPKVAKILVGEDETAVVIVELDSRDKTQGLLWAPIDVKLLDAGGNVVAETNTEGADPAIVHVPFVPPGGKSFYVNDLLSPTATPVSATVTLGGKPIAIPPGPDQLKTTAKSFVDPDYGPSFEGTVTNDTSVRQEQVIVQAIARKGADIVAAGTSIVKGLEPGASQEFQGLFIGDPRGAVLTVSAPVSNLPGMAGAPPG
jgi:hypothetical protein